jgi:hypothetical protein
MFGHVRACLPLFQLALELLNLSAEFSFVVGYFWSHSDFSL